MCSNIIKLYNCPWTEYLSLGLVTQFTSSNNDNNNSGLTIERLFSVFNTKS